MASFKTGPEELEAAEKQENCSCRSGCVVQREGVAGGAGQQTHLLPAKTPTSGRLFARKYNSTSVSINHKKQRQDIDSICALLDEGAEGTLRKDLTIYVKLGRSNNRPTTTAAAIVTSWLFCCPGSVISQ